MLSKFMTSLLWVIFGMILLFGIYLALTKLGVLS